MVSERELHNAVDEIIKAIICVAISGVVDSD